MIGAVLLRDYSGIAVVLLGDGCGTPVGLLRDCCGVAVSCHWIVVTCCDLLLLAIGLPLDCPDGRREGRTK